MTTFGRANGSCTIRRHRMDAQGTEDREDVAVDLRSGTGIESTENAQCRYFWTVPRVALKFGASATHLDLTVKCEALDGIRHFTGSPRWRPGQSRCRRNASFEWPV
jgi:hypothetical protein